MDNCRIYKYKRFNDSSIKNALYNVLKLANNAIRNATSKLDKDVLYKVIKITKDFITKARDILPAKEDLIAHIKAYSELLRLNIGIKTRQIIMFMIRMIEKSYEKEAKDKKEEEINKKAEEAAKAAAEAAYKAIKKKSSKSDSYGLLRLYKDSLAIRRALIILKHTLIAKKFTDDKRRISTTMTPTMWEKKYVLGIKPGVSFNEKDWRAYKENGFVIVENKRTGQRYQKSQSELVAAANNEKAMKMNTADPLIGTAGYEYGNVDAVTPQQKLSLRNIIKKIGMTITAITGTIAAIKALKSSASGWSASLRNLLATSLSWMQTAKDTWQEVKNVTK